MKKRQAKKIVKSFRKELLLNVNTYSYHRYLRALDVGVKQERKNQKYYQKYLLFITQLSKAGIAAAEAGRKLANVFRVMA